jgi:hypothetical protein
MSKQTLRVPGARPLLDISYGRGGHGQTMHIPLAEREAIWRTVRRVSEVMIKITGGGRDARHVAAHFKYIGRQGRLEILTDDRST